MVLLLVVIDVIFIPCFSVSKMSLNFPSDLLIQRCQENRKMEFAVQRTPSGSLGAIGRRSGGLYLGTRLVECSGSVDQGSADRWRWFPALLWGAALSRYSGPPALVTSTDCPRSSTGHAGAFNVEGASKAFFFSSLWSTRPESW